jgi:uncharacterized protein YbbC (DUF1343 family)
MRQLIYLGGALTAAVWFAGCQSNPPARSGPPVAPAKATRTAPKLTPTGRDSSPLAPQSAFYPQKLAEMDAAIQTAIGEKRLPGGVLWLEREGSAYRKVYGNRAVDPAREPMSEDTIFDAASLTKVVATTPSIMLLVERGRIQVDAPVKTYIPEFAGEGRDNVTIRHLMTHTSGIRPGLAGTGVWSGYDKAIQLASMEKLRTPPGTAFVYSDINFILLGEVVRRVSGVPLNEFAAREIYGPLKMQDTGFLPPAEKLGRIAPTTVNEGEGVLRGRVHDPTSRKMGGVAGHAGLFVTAHDLARYARMYLNNGTLDGVRLFKPETVALMTSVQSPPAVASRRGLGWDIDSSYSGPRGTLFPIGSFGHTGWTGTSIWMDPFSRTFLIFLSNRNHPTEAGSVIALRGKLGTLAAESVRGFNFAYVPGVLPARSYKEKPAQAEVLNGIDVLARQDFAPLKGLRIGLITNHTGADRRRNPTIDLLHKALGAQLKVLFSPEHGIRGLLDEKVSDGVDDKTGLPVFSLYGERRSPAPAQLKDLDALVYDIQDIGCRFYTYEATMGNCLEAAGKAKLKFFVLDRVNPINGTTIEGPIYDGESKFIAFHSVPLRHGMTLGELARMYNAERKFGAQLTVIQAEGWWRDYWFDQTGLPWRNPSPNMRSLTEAALYPGIGLLETAVSVGRGTDTPFEVVGAPYVDDVVLAHELNRAGLVGVRFLPHRFKPTASVFKDKDCGGVQIILTDRDRCPVVDVGITIIQTLQRLYPGEFALGKADTLLLHPSTIEAIKAGKSLAEIKADWSTKLEAFKQRRERYLIYK